MSPGWSGGGPEDLAGLDTIVQPERPVVKSSDGIMEILEACDLTGGLHGAAQAGCDHKTVPHYFALRNAGHAPDRRPRRSTVIDVFLVKVEECVDRSNGRIRADVVPSWRVLGSQAGEPGEQPGVVVPARPRRPPLAVDSCRHLHLAVCPADVADSHGRTRRQRCITVGRILPPEGGQALPHGQESRPMTRRPSPLS
jgi:hypothetical protein